MMKDPNDGVDKFATAITVVLCVAFVAATSAVLYAIFRPDKSYYEFFLISLLVFTASAVWLGRK